MNRRLKLAWVNIGGEQFLKPGYYLPAPFLLLIAGVQQGNSHSPNWSVLSGYFFANLWALGICIGVAFLVSRYKNRRRIFFSPSLVLGVAVVIGILKAVFTTFFLNLLALETDPYQHLVSRLPGAVTASLITITSISMFASMAMIYRAEQQRILLSRVSKQQSALTSAVFEELEGWLAELHSQSTLERNLGDSRGLILRMLEEKIKPLSKEIWARESKGLRSFEFKDLLQQTVFQDPYPAFLLALLLPFVTPIWPAIISGDWAQVGVEGLQITAIWAAFTILNSLKGKLKKPILAIATGGVIALVAALAGYAIPVILGEESPASSVFTMIFLGGFLPTMALVFGFGKSFISASIEQDKHQQNELNDLSAWNTTELDAILASRELAAALHGKIQNQMLLSVSRISAGETTLVQELDEVEELVNSLKISIYDGSNVPIQELIDSFSEFIKVEISSPSPEIPRAKARIIEEAISNAYRHGRASMVNVSLDLEQSHLVVADNGLGPTNGARGLGSVIYDSAGNWELLALKNGGSQLNLHFANHSNK